LVIVNFNTEIIAESSVKSYEQEPNVTLDFTLIKDTKLILILI
jgi:hypothetical protein